VKSQLIRVPFLLLSLLGFTLSAAEDLDLPEDKGKDVVESTCIDCHSSERIKAQHLDEEGWNAVVREMIENGASINANDVKTIVDYLSKNFGPEKKVNINRAKADEIATALKLAPIEVDAVVQYRTRHGKFKDLSELESLPGLSDKIEAKKALIEF
jgi:competence ComEA-like helix-hairpin-helix protein